LYFVKSDLLVSSFLARAAAVSKVKLEEPELPELLLDLNAELSLPLLEPEEYLLPELPL
jgi:hypothetical protein